MVLGIGARRRVACNAQVGIGNGWSGETAVIRLSGEVVRHPESVVLPLLLPDSPVAVWWPADHPADPAEDPLGRLAQRRITDAAFVSRGKIQALHEQCAAYAPGQHRPGLDPDHAVAGAARRRPGPAAAQGDRECGSRPSGSARAPTC